MTARILLVLLLAVLAWGAPSIAHAQSCGVVDTAIDFGVFDPAAGAVKTGQGTVKVGCFLQRVPVTIQLGTGQSNSYASRTMTTTGGSMTYNLYTTAALATVWGNGSGTTQSVQCTTGNDSASGCIGSFEGFFIFYATYPVYGRIAASQPNAVVGAYTDNVVVTMIF